MFGGNRSISAQYLQNKMALHLLSWKLLEQSPPINTCKLSYYYLL